MPCPHQQGLSSYVHAPSYDENQVGLDMVSGESKTTLLSVLCFIVLPLCVFVRIFRDARGVPFVALRTATQRHKFNQPYQLGTGSRDKAHDAREFLFYVRCVPGSQSGESKAYSVFEMVGCFRGRWQFSTRRSPCLKLLVLTYANHSSRTLFHIERGI